MFLWLSMTLCQDPKFGPTHEECGRGKLHGAQKPGENGEGKLLERLWPAGWRPWTSTVFGASECEFDDLQAWMMHAATAGL